MPSARRTTSPPDQAQRDLALDPRRSILVRAPAGSGKTTLLSQRFLSLLAEVDEPGQVVAITFTNAAAAEMRNRILDDLRQDVPGPIASRALQRSQQCGWDLLNLPAQLRISTIDSFCRDLALQQPVLSGLGGSLEIREHPNELYRRAARRTLEQIGQANAALSAAIETLLDWRDNNWREIEDLTVEMLGNRDRWMQDFVLEGEQDFDRLRSRLESPLLRADGESAPIRYSDAEWKIIRACFTLLRRAAADLRVVFAEAAAADFTEVAQIALNVLKGEDGFPIDAAQAVADGIRHLLVDEFQDTSRRQHELLRRLIAAGPDREGRTCFVVGDPMQSIYGFREADAELFPRVEELGLEIPGDLPFIFDSVHLTANFRSESSLVASINETFAQVFAASTGAGITFAASEPARAIVESSGPQLVTTPVPRMQLHCAFIPESPRNAGPGRKKEIAEERNIAQQRQIDEIVALIRGHLPRIEAAVAANQKYRVAVLARARKSLVPIAAALRDAGIHFRAVELEKLKDRPEIIDALSLTRALFNPHHRVAWLGLLRAPWCGLSLADLHTLVSADSSEVLTRPVPELLAERSQLISLEGRPAVDRTLRALAAAATKSASQPTSTPGTRLEQTWLQLGGAKCVDTEARANLDLFWRCLDSLPQGEPDLLGSALTLSLDDLKAQPDPAASSDRGVQLMTIHGAKGLEFEVVIVPDLQAPPGRHAPGMLSWLERGLAPDSASADPEPSDVVTEFLIAPFQQKGSDSSKAKKWVDRQRHERELHEACRLLYVAATRARDELYLFARPKYKTGKDGKHLLADPAESLLKTAWPAFEQEIKERFADWRAVKEIEDLADEDQPEENEWTIDSIAASGDETAPEMSTPRESPPDKPTQMRRLPPGFRSETVDASLRVVDEPLVGAGRLYERHEGGLISRALGNAVHALLQQFAQLVVSQTREAALATLTRRQPRIAATIRAAGIEPATSNRIATQALQIVNHATGDPLAQWILAPHADAGSEIRWTGVVAGAFRTVQVDRVFRAGPAPQTPGEEAWWIIDYKTAHEDGLDGVSALPELRRQFAPQIETYAAVLRNLRGAEINLCGGLYYPRMALFDWWQL